MLNLTVIFKSKSQAMTNKERLLSGFYARCVKPDEFFIKKDTGEKVPYDYNLKEKKKDLKKHGYLIQYYEILQIRISSYDTAEQKVQKIILFYANVEGEFLEIAKKMENEIFDRRSNCYPFSIAHHDSGLELHFTVNESNLVADISKNDNVLTLSRQPVSGWEDIKVLRYIPYTSFKFS